MTTIPMADRTATAPPGRTGGSVDEVEILADRFMRLMRAFGRGRDKFHTRSRELEWNPAIVLKTIATCGPLRLSQLVEVMRLDTSTLSRYVSGLVKDGYVERVADQDDGRASVLQATPQAATVIAALDAKRIEFFRDVVADWSTAEIAALAEALSRFENDFTEHIDRLTVTDQPSNHHSPAVPTHAVHTHAEHTSAEMPNEEN